VEGGCDRRSVDGHPLCGLPVLCSLWFQSSSILAKGLFRFGAEPPSKARLPPACLSQNMFLFVHAVIERFVGWFAECEWTNGVNVVVNWSVLVVLLLIHSVLFYNPVITRRKYLNEHCQHFKYFCNMWVKLKLSVATP